MGVEKDPVTVIGLGPMGQAMARAFLKAGHPTTVWNRTASRADAVVAEGAVRARSAAEALAAGRLVVLSLTDYDAMYAILGEVGDALRGRVVVNLSSDTPGRAREATAWFAGHGAEHLAGGIMVPAELVATESSYVFYSGPKAEFDRYEPVLRVLGRPDFRGTDPALGQAFYQAQLHVFLTSLAAYLESVALLGAVGVTAETFQPYVKDLFDTMSYYLPGATKHLDNGDHPGDAANVTMMGATADHIVGAAVEAGIDGRLPAAVKALYDSAIADGRGKESWTSLVEVIRKPA
ncbi:NAD(P)-dependent oxidoreductase [Amycolatopsis minnesotensis]